MITLGVLSDTHIPDRAAGLHPAILPLYRQKQVCAILHAGDVSTRTVLQELETVAPVHAVRGNRDYLLLRDLPAEQRLVFGGVPILLTHGHGRWWNYVIDRTDYMLRGFHFERFRPRLQAAYPAARVVVFGHTHIPLNLWLDGQLLFNPGSPHVPDKHQFAPSVGLLHIHTGGEIHGEIVLLPAVV